MSARHLPATVRAAGVLAAGVLAASMLAACAPPSPQTEGACSAPVAWSIPEQVAELWRCELSAAGLTPQDAAGLAADAVVLSSCESAWNPAAVAYGGRYVTSPNPLTGTLHSAAGVFQLRRSDADEFVPGGYREVLDPQANIVGAARLFLAGYRAGGRQAGFAPWPCATDDPSVLPGFPGGPAALPSWAYRY
jgi:hypothetical protein